MADKFQKKTLNRKDHEKMDTNAKNVRNGVGVGALIISGIIAGVKFIPKIIKHVSKV